LVVFFASVVVPLAKIATLSYLSWCVERGSSRHPRDLTKLYRFTEAVGAWSMVDVFLVGLLVSLVSLGLLASVTPGIGVNFFAAAVILTIIAAHSFDPRLIWDNAQATKVSQP
jgi:paraquat-inducible protein A